MSAVAERLAYLIRYPAASRPRREGPRTLYGRRADLGAARKLHRIAFPGTWGGWRGVKMPREFYAAIGRKGGARPKKGRGLNA